MLRLIQLTDPTPTSCLRQIPRWSEVLLGIMPES